MIKDETQTISTKVEEKSNATSPISKDDKKETTKKTNAFVAWLKDEDTVDENDGKITGKTAFTSYAKGLIEIVKTIYKRPLASGITIATGIVLTYYASITALPIVMGIATAAGAAGIIYGGYTAATTKSSNKKRQAYEVLGISTFVLAVGLYGLFM